jgi:hypothetical protein
VSDTIALPRLCEVTVVDDSDAVPGGDREPGARRAEWVRAAGRGYSAGSAGPAIGGSADSSSRRITVIARLTSLVGLT